MFSVRLCSIVALPVLLQERNGECLGSVWFERFSREVQQIDIICTDQFDISSIVLRALATGCRNVSNSVFKISTIRRDLITQEDTRQLPVVHVVVSTIREIIVNDLAGDCVQTDAFNDWWCIRCP